MAILDGKGVAAQLREELRQEIALHAVRPPRLDVILVGEEVASSIYVKGKVAACLEVGIEAHVHRHTSEVSQRELLDEIADLNENPFVDGILVQLPLPKGIDERLVTWAVDPAKDVDGFHPMNRGKLLLGEERALFPCTPLAVSELFARYAISTQGKHVVIVGRSDVVGKPLAVLLLQKGMRGNATVTVAHSFTEDLASLSVQADILVAALGRPRFITAPMVKEGAVVIDVGINALVAGQEGERRKIVGDVDYVEVAKKCSWITPVPGGVGPMTIAMLLSNTWKAYRSHL